MDQCNGDANDLHLWILNMLQIFARHEVNYSHTTLGDPITVPVLQKRQGWEWAQGHSLHPEGPCACPSWIAVPERGAPTSCVRQPLEDLCALQPQPPAQWSCWLCHGRLASKHPVWFSAGGTGQGASPGVGPAPRTPRVWEGASS